MAPRPLRRDLRAAQAGVPGAFFDTARPYDAEGDDLFTQALFPELAFPSCATRSSCATGAASPSRCSACPRASSTTGATCSRSRPASATRRRGTRTRPTGIPRIELPRRRQLDAARRRRRRQRLPLVRARLAPRRGARPPPPGDDPAGPHPRAGRAGRHQHRGAGAHQGGRRVVPPPPHAPPLAAQHHRRRPARLRQRVPDRPGARATSPPTGRGSTRAARRSRPGPCSSRS